VSDITRVLQEIRSGDRSAADRLLSAVYDELRRLAAQRLKGEPPGQTLQATELVHEAYLRLLGPNSSGWENRAHFFAAAAEAMRRIVVDAARRRGRQKRGGGRQRRELDEADVIELPASVDVLALDEALHRLAQFDRVKAQLVTLRFFGGLSVAEAGEAIGISRATADRYWTFARAWLYNELREQERTRSS
jgi:RNA polymerase sigma factor (TIGR02999 family)